MIFLLTGPVHSGKTSFLKQVVHKLREQRIHVDGYLSEVFLKNKEILGYNLLDLREMSSVRFIRTNGLAKWQRIGPYFFIPQGLARACKIIARAKDADLLVVDEVGPLEIDQKGIWPALKKVLSEAHVRLLLVARKSLLGDLLKRLEGTEVRIFDIQEKEIFSRLIKEIKNQFNS